MRRLLCGVLLAGSLLLAPAALAAPIQLESAEVSATEAPPPGHALNALGPEDVQAGSHPYALTTRVLLGTEIFTAAGKNAARVEGGGLKDGRLELPPGFVGNPNAVPKCPYTVFFLKHCPNDTAIGEATSELIDASETFKNRKGEVVATTITVTDPVYNLEGPGGVAGEFGYLVKEVAPILSDFSVRTGSDYGITAVIHNIPEPITVFAPTIKIWGVPAAPSHDRVRGHCLSEDETYSNEVEYGLDPPHNEEESRLEQAEREGTSTAGIPVECPANVPVLPLLTNPTSCATARTATVSVDDWETPGNFTTGEHVSSKTFVLPELTGCDKLDFSPTLTVTPDGSAGSTPTGLNVEVHVPQEATVNPVGLGEADVRDTTVALPAGVQVSPSASDGLQACSDAQIGFTGVNPLTGTDEFTPELPKPLLPGVNFCPDASKIANVRITTPVLEHELTGAVYLAAPQNFAGPAENPFSALVAMYLVAEEPVTGVLVKLPGEVSLNQATGQLTATFENTPQAPVSELKLEFYGTDRAPLAMPGLCGTYTTETAFTPWSGTAPADPSSSFQIASGPNGAPCSDPLPFAPVLASGSTNINAGSFSALTTTLSREDGQQNIQQVTLHYPPGLSGILSGIKLCGEPEANAGTCGPESEIGETIVSVGLGNDPFSVTGGKVYLTGPYEGAPFGLSIVNPAKAGPFDLQEGRPVVVRATVNVDPHTAALTVTTNTAAQGYAIPSMIEGIPLQIKHVNVDITRPGFTFNPTDCNPTRITGTVASAEDASVPVSIPFQVTNCANLKFAPQFSVSTLGKTSKLDGASLTAKVSYPNVPQGTDADIASVKVELPKQLPSRLSTLQKACTAAQFNTNYADCPAASVIGHAVVHTPLLPVPLEGPAYFVSNGGEAFPNLIMVLQGYGITIDLVGDTFISKTGITSTTFKAVPDQPFSSFELTLPEGPYSALAANGNLCSLTKTVTVKKKTTVKVNGHRKTETRSVRETRPGSLEVPSAFVGQNGAEIHQDTPVTVSGCPRAKTTAKTASKKHKQTSRAEKQGRRK